MSFLKTNVKSLIESIHFGYQKKLPFFKKTLYFGKNCLIGIRWF